MNPSTLANYEAVLNICANLSEIVGLRIGLGFVLAAILVAFLKEWKCFGWYLGTGLVVGLVGLAAPGLINLTVASLTQPYSESAFTMLAVICGVSAAVITIVGIALLAYPLRVAKQRGGTSFGWIIGLSIASIAVAPLWSVSLFLAHKAKPVAPVASATSGDATPL